MSRTLLLASAAVGVAMLPLGAAQAQTAFDWSGFYAGVHAGFLDGNVHVTDEGIPVTGNLQGPIAGVLAGYNFPSSPFPQAVLGLEADVGFGDIHGTGSAMDPDAISNVFRYDFDWDLHARFRFGWPTGTAMPFVAAGLAFAQLHVVEGGGGPDLGGLYTGITLGAGVDLKIAPNMIARLEGLADHYLTKSYPDYSVNFSAWTVRGALIVRLP